MKVFNKLFNVIALSLMFFGVSATANAQITLSADTVSVLPDGEECHPPKCRRLFAEHQGLEGQASGTPRKTIKRELIERDFRPRYSVDRQLLLSDRRGENARKTAPLCGRLPAFGR